MLYKHFSAPWIWPPSVENRHGAGQGGHLITSSGPLLGLCGNAGAQYRGPASYSQPVALHLKPTLHICRWQCGGISLAVGGQNQPNRKTGSRGPRSRLRGGKPLELWRPTLKPHLCHPMAPWRAASAVFVGFGLNWSSFNRHVRYCRTWLWKEG